MIFNEHEFVHLKAEKGIFSECAGNRKDEKELTGFDIELGRPTSTNEKAPTEIDENNAEEPAQEPEIKVERLDVRQVDQTELEDYQLARDRTRREIKPPRRYAEADLIAHALASVSPE